MGLLGIDDFAHGLSDLGHGITEGAGDLVDNTSDAAGGWLSNGGHALDQVLPGPDIYGDVGDFGHGALDLGGNIAETTIDLGGAVANLPGDSAVTALDGVGDFVSWGNDSLTGLGDLSNGLLNGDFSAAGDWVDYQSGINRDFGDNLVDSALDGPLGPEEFTQNYLENDFFDLSDEGKSWGEQAHDLTDQFFDDNSLLFEPPISIPFTHGGDVIDGMKDAIDSGQAAGPISAPLGNLFGDDATTDLGGAAGVAGGALGGLGSVPGGLGASVGGALGSAGAAWQGMDVEAVEASARQLQELAQRTTSLTAKVDGEVSDLGANWNGVDSQRYVQQWQGQYKAVLTRSAKLLEQMAQDALHQVATQKSTSGH